MLRIGAQHFRAIASVELMLTRSQSLSTSDMGDVPFSRLELAAALIEMEEGTEGRAQHSAIFTPFREPADYFPSPPSPVAESTFPASTIARPLSTMTLARPESALSLRPAEEPGIDDDELLSQWGLDGRTEDRVNRPSMETRSFSLAATLAPVRFDDDDDEIENERPRRPSTSMSRRPSTSMSRHSFDALRPVSPAFSEAMSTMSSGAC